MRLKIGITDGCANGGMMDSLSIYEMEDGDEPYFTTTVTAEKWAEWKAFLKLHDKWEQFWDAKLMAAERRKLGREPR